jgi:hypothetical protein
MSLNAWRPDGAPRTVRNNTHEQLLMLRASVSPDGDAARFAVHFTNGRPFRVEIGAGEFPAWFAEMRHASALLVARQRLTLDRGAARLLELCDTAVHPAGSDIIPDPVTGDRVLLFQFHEHAPFAVRLSPADLLFHLQQVAGATRVMLH